jgi:hypothetical protein
VRQSPSDQLKLGKAFRQSRAIKNDEESNTQEHPLYFVSAWVFSFETKLDRALFAILSYEFHGRIFIARKTSRKLRFFPKYTLGRKFRNLLSSLPPPLTKILPNFQIVSFWTIIWTVKWSLFGVSGEGSYI